MTAALLYLTPTSTLAGIIRVHFEGTVINQCEVTGNPQCHDVYLYEGTSYSGSVTLDLDRLRDPQVFESNDPDDHLYDFRGELYSNLSGPAQSEPFLLDLEVQGEGWSHRMDPDVEQRESLYLKRFLEETPFSDYNALTAGPVELTFSADWGALDEYRTGQTKGSDNVLWLHGMRYHFPPDSDFCCHPAYRVYGFHDEVWVEDVARVPSAGSLALLLAGLPLLWHRRRCSLRK